MIEIKSKMNAGSTIPIKLGTVSRQALFKKSVFYICITSTIILNFVLNVFEA
jgi:hypothetical protein